MDWENVFNSLWDFAISITQAIDSIWEFLTSPVELSALGMNVISFTPIEMFGGGMIITLLVFGFIKAFVPGAWYYVYKIS